MTHHVAPPLSTPSAQLPPTAQRITPPRTPAAGATARLVALPQLDGRLPHDPSAVDGYLASMQGSAGGVRRQRRRADGADDRLRQ